MEQMEFKDSMEESLVKEFLCSDAQEAHDSHEVRTRLYFDENQNMVGFFSLYNDLVHLTEEAQLLLVNRFSWKFPNQGNITHFPAIKLHYLGVDKRWRGRGIGDHLIQEVIDIAYEAREHSGCKFISVEALPNSVEFYLKEGFKYVSLKEGLHTMILNLATIDDDEAIDVVSYSTNELLTAKEKIIDMREQKKVSTEKLAELSGLRVDEIEKFEFSSALPSLELLQILANALEISELELYRI